MAETQKIIAYVDAEAISDALFSVARGLGQIATAIERLGMNDASGPMGAMEGAAHHLGEKIDRLADSISEALSSND